MRTRRLESGERTLDNWFQRGIGLAMNWARDNDLYPVDDDSYLAWMRDKKFPKRGYEHFCPPKQGEQQ